jgi:hypothetical protein
MAMKNVKKTKQAALPEDGDAAYYYAGGQRVHLTRADDLVAVDKRRLAKEHIGDEIRIEVEKVSKPLMGGISLVSLTDLGSDAEKMVKVLKKAGALQPVYKADGAILVALPEVRVEETRKVQQEKLEKWLKAHAAATEVQRSDDGPMVVKPASGDGDDALMLANALTEAVQPELVQPRFLRVTPRPSTIGTGGHSKHAK